MPEVEMGSKRDLASSWKICPAATCSVYALLHGSSMEVPIASTPTTSFPCQGTAATGPALSPCPRASPRRHQNYSSEGACHVRCGEELPWTPSPAYLRLHSFSSVQDKPQVTSFDCNIEAFALQPFT